MWSFDTKKSGFRSIGTTEQEKSEANNATTKVNLKDVSMASCANDYVVFTNKVGRVYTMGDLKVKGVNNNQAKTKTDII